MPNEVHEVHTDPPPGLSVAARRTRLLAAVSVTVVVVMSIVGIVVSRGNDQRLPSAATATINSQTTVGTSTTRSPEDDVVARLREILEIRDRVLLTRNESLLSTIYTVDCECLQDGRALIRQLRKEGVVWKGVKTNIDIEQTEHVNDQLWVIVATVTTPPVRIETESGRLIRVVPPERNSVRFVLAKSQSDKDWLLGHASGFG